MTDIHLRARPSTFLMPSYSLTSDLLSFLRCGLQYRVTGIGRLPSSEPVQMWFGQFIHGVMEEAYRRYGQAAEQAFIDRFGGEHFDPAKDRGRGKQRDYWMRDTMGDRRQRYPEILGQA